MTEEQTDSLVRVLEKHATLARIFVAFLIAATVWATTIQLSVRANTTAIEGIGRRMEPIAQAVQRLVTLEEASARRAAIDKGNNGGG